MRIPLVFWREYWGHVTSRSYILFTFGFPLMMVGAPLVFGVLLVAVINWAIPAPDPRPVGIVDQPGLLSGADLPKDDTLSFELFESPADAQQALDAGDIQGYYNIQPDYWQSGEIVLTNEESLNILIEQTFQSLVRRQVRDRLPEEISERLQAGPDIIRQGTSDEAETYDASNLMEPILIYFLVYLVRLGGSFTASFMFDSIARESDDRTIEILITSVSPFEFVTGKLLGLMAVGLTQLSMWGGTALLLAVPVGYAAGFDLLGAVLGWEHTGLLISVLLATYILDQILAAAMGLLRVSGGAGTLIFNWINVLVGVGLIYAAYFVPPNPHTLLAIGASFFPLTAPVVLPIRVVVSSVPLWQVILSQAILWTSCVGGLFLLRRLLKANLVAHGQPFKVWAWLRDKRPWRRKPVSVEG